VPTARHGAEMSAPGLFFSDGLQVGKAGLELLADHGVHTEEEMHDFRDVALGPCMAHVTSVTSPLASSEISKRPLPTSFLPSNSYTAPLPCAAPRPLPSPWWPPRSVFGSRAWLPDRLDWLYLLVEQGAAKRV